MTEVRQQLRNQTLTDLTADSISTVGGRIFPDGTAIGDLGALLQIVEAWRDVHAPTYGAPIPGTGNVQSLAAAEANTWQDVIAPSGQEVTSIQFVGLYNSDVTTPATVDIGLTDADGTAYVAASLQVDPQSFVNGFSLGSQPLLIDSNITLQFRVKTGPYASVTIRTYAINVVG